MVLGLRSGCKVRIMKNQVGKKMKIAFETMFTFGCVKGRVMSSLTHFWLAGNEMDKMETDICY